MADRVRKVSYCYVTTPHRATHGSRVLGELREAGVNLLAFSGFPAKGGKAQLDMVADNMAGIRRVARRNGWRLSKSKKAFLVQGKDVPGAVHRQVAKLSEAKISVVSAQAVAAGRGRYGMILWVKPKDYARAARILRAK
jgi:hypothetical protein